MPSRVQSLVLVALLASPVASLACGGAGASRSAAASPGAAARHAFDGAEPARRVPSDIAFQSLEGPFWSAADGVLLFSDVVDQNAPAAKIYRYSPASGAFAVQPYPVVPTTTNGLGADPQGNLLACERTNGALVRIAGGQRTVVANRFPVTGGLSLAAPNDVAVRADGNIYFSDTKWGGKDGPHAEQAVYRVAPDGAVTVAYAVSMPNGVALSPDGRTLYVGSDAQNRVWKLPVDAAGAAGAATVLIDATRVPGGLFKVPDGICIDDTGNLYVANNDDAVKAIEVFTPDGGYLGDIALADNPSNCAFGGADRRTLFVTTPHAIYEAKVTTTRPPVTAPLTCRVRDERSGRGDALPSA